jgi:hypothetical protein
MEDLGEAPIGGLHLYRGGGAGQAERAIWIGLGGHVPVILRRGGSARPVSLKLTGEIRK